MRNNRENGSLYQQITKGPKERVGSRLADLKSELREYEFLKSGQFPVDELEVVTGMPSMLIKERAAWGRTRRELVEQIRLRAGTRIPSACLSRIREVV